MWCIDILLLLSLLNCLCNIVCSVCLSLSVFLLLSCLLYWRININITSATSLAEVITNKSLNVNNNNNDIHILQLIKPVVEKNITTAR